jgi:hypothetical protein
MPSGPMTMRCKSRSVLPKYSCAPFGGRQADAPPGDDDRAHRVLMACGSVAARPGMNLQPGQRRRCRWPSAGDDASRAPPARGRLRRLRLRHCPKGRQCLHVAAPPLSTPSKWSTRRGRPTPRSLGATVHTRGPARIALAPECPRKPQRSAIIERKKRNETRGYPCTFWALSQNGTTDRYAFRWFSKRVKAVLKNG